jgi:hypothetical protein
MLHHACVYETFGISKYFPVKLQEFWIRAETIGNPLTPQCFLLRVCALQCILRYRMVP